MEKVNNRRSLGNVSIRIAKPPVIRIPFASRITIAGTVAIDLGPIFALGQMRSLGNDSNSEGS
jgi:hypothetical protein